MPIISEKAKTWLQGARKPSPQSSLKTSGSSTTLSSKSTRNNEKISTDSSTENSGSAEIVRSPDMRMFELAKELKDLKKKEEARLAQEAAKWRGGKGPVDPSEHRGSNATSAAVDTHPSTRVTGKAAFKTRHGLFGQRSQRGHAGQSNWRITGWPNPRRGFRRSSLVKPVSKIDINNTPSRTPSTSEPFWSAVEDVDKDNSGRSFRVSASIGPDNTTKSRPDSTLKFGSSPRGKRVAWQEHSRSISESTSATNDSKSTTPGLSGRSLRLPKWVVAPGTYSPNDSPSARSSRRERPAFEFSLPDVHTSWTQRIRGGTPVEQESLSAPPEVMTPACFSRRKGVLDFEHIKSEPSYFSGVAFRDPTTERFQVHAPSPTNSRLPASALLRTSQGAWARHNDSENPALNEAITLPTKRTTTCRPLVKKDWYQIRMDAILQDHAGFDHTAEAEASVQNIPDHLPNSPLCPQHPKHKSSGGGICVYHGKSNSAFARTAELSL